MPGKDLPEVHIVNFDKFAHVFVFGVLNGLYLLWNRNTDRPNRFNTLLISLACIAYGGAIELLQGVLYIDRHSDILDFIANSIGCASALMLFRRIKL